MNIKGHSKRHTKVLRYLVHLKQILIVTLIKTTYQDINQKSTKDLQRYNGVYKDNHDPMGKIEEAYKTTY